MTTSTASTAPSSTAGRDRRTYTIIAGLAGVAILLQAVWAGLFVHEGEDYTESWVEVHARGADIAIGLAVIAAVFAFVKLRERRDLWIGAGAMAVLLVLEAYIGGLVGDHPGVTVAHFPIGMALMGLAVWLPLRAGRSVTTG